MKNATLFTANEMKTFNKVSPLFAPYQMKIINRKTPASEVEIKKDANGCNYKSVKAGYVKALVMMVTGGAYVFEILNREHIKETREVIVHAKLSINTVNGVFISREQFGQHYLQKTVVENGNKKTYLFSDIGNGYKAAASDAFKKCASEFGFCWDVYNQERPEPVASTKTEHKDSEVINRLNEFLTKCVTSEDIERTYEGFIHAGGKETESTKVVLRTHLERVGVVFDE